MTWRTPWTSRDLHGILYFMAHNSFMTETVVSSVVPRIYSDLARELRAPTGTDISRQPKCHVLTHDLLVDLRARGLPCRRELHTVAIDSRPDPIWHYVIAHVEQEAEPTELDIITDLTPWQFEKTGAYSGFLHATRQRVQDTLRRALMPEPAVALRGIQTIALQHTERIVPPLNFNLSLTG